MSQDATLYAHLAASLEAMRDEYVRLLRESIPFYQAMPEAPLRASAEAVLRRFLDESLSTWDLEPSVTWTIHLLRARAAAGLGRDEALAVGTCFRRLFLHRVASLLEAKVPDVPRLLLFTDEFCELLNAEVRRVYDDALAQAQKALRESEARYRELVEVSPDGVAVHRDERFLYVNPAGMRIMGFEAAVGVDIVSIFPPDRRDQMRAIIREAVASLEPSRPMQTVFQRPDGHLVDVEVMGTAIVFEGSPARQIVFRDITERAQTEQALERAAMQEQIIRAQEATLRELSTPLIPVSDDVVVMPIVGLVDRVRAEQMQKVLLEGISAAAAKVAILDVTGVPAMDAGVAEALLSAVSAARLLGAEVVLTGIKPGAAQALVQLGVDFGRVVTRATLKDGIAHALGRQQGGRVGQSGRAARSGAG